MKIHFGTGSRFGRLNNSLASNIVNYALSKGIVSFDTGFNYGEGSSQKLLAHCLRSSIKLSREALFISSKSGTLFKSQNGLKCFDSDYIDATIRKTVRDFSDTYLDAYYLHGPSLADLQSPELANVLISLKHEGLIKSIGVNTHDIELMEHISSGKFDYISRVMIDYNLVQQDRCRVIDQFMNSGILVSAGTALCQGLLLQSPLSLFLRSRSLFYLFRLLFKSSSRRFLAPCSIARKIISDHFAEYSPYVPLAFLLQDERIESIPVGMLSKSSIDSNLFASSLNLDSEQISRVSAIIKDTLHSFGYKIS